MLVGGPNGSQHTPEAMNRGQEQDQEIAGREGVNEDILTSLACEDMEGMQGRGDSGRTSSPYSNCSYM